MRRSTFILFISALSVWATGCTKPEGSSGGACYGNDTCNDGLRCEGGRCVEPEPGLEGNPCYGNNTCNDGLACEAGICVTDPNLLGDGDGDGDAVDVGDGDRVDGDGVEDAGTAEPTDGGSAPEGPADAGPDTGGIGGDGDGAVDDPVVDPSGDPVEDPVDVIPASGGWLEVVGNGIFTENGARWVGRGANIHDSRGCGACAYDAPRVDEVIRRIDALVDDWGADFMRLDLESYGENEAESAGMTNYKDVLADPAYLEEIRTIVDHVAEKPGVFIMLSLWIHPSFSDLGWPTTDTNAVWEVLATEFANDPHVLFGIVNEPEYNYNGAYNADVWQSMDDAVATIRAVEDGLGTPHHVVAVQGTGGWSRHLGYYVDHPILAGGGDNVAYEIHVYDPQSEFESMFVEPSATLPVIIGEYGPAAGMTEADCEVLQDKADELGIPHLAWTFHQRCPPNLIVDYSNGGCGFDMPIEPTGWGSRLMSHLQGQ